MSSSELRQKFIDFYVKRGHVEITNQPLVPENDPTTLFIGSGMQPLVPYLLGQPHPQGKRLVNIQKSLRTEDLDEVGNERHHTLFEMMGNWSLGDYFKAEQLHWAFEFFVDELKLDANKLYVTVFEGDEHVPQDSESVDIWKQVYAKYGISAKDSHDKHDLVDTDNRIFYYPREKNWWERANAPVGDPAGPDSEVFYDTGKKHDPDYGESCHVNCDCGKFIEIANNVFMEYEKTNTGYLPLENKNVDVGWGLERIVRVVQNKTSNFETDLFLPVIKKLEEFSAVKYGESKRGDFLYRIIADHIRASTFLIADGVIPSNKQQGYVLRRLLRRVIRFSSELSTKKEFLVALADVIVDNYGQSYPHLKEKQGVIRLEITKEEEKFQKALDKGLRELKKMMDSADKVVSGEQAFKLYETYGFPLELTVEIARESGYSVDEQGFSKIRAAAVEKSRSLDKGIFSGGLGEESEKTVWYHTLTHLLHQALRDELGDHAQQAGSNITPNRLRFDFTHNGALTDEQIEKIEETVNKQKGGNLDVTMQTVSLKEAQDMGATAFFKEKYGESVNVYKIGDYSLEICGGPHVKNTSEIKGKFKILKEKSVGAGVRRIRAVVE